MQFHPASAGLRQPSAGVNPSPASRLEPASQALAQLAALAAGSNPGECRCSLGLACEDADLAQAGFAQTHETRRARQTIYRRGDPSQDVIVICSGWAFRYNQLSDGRRQILSILLPGDVISATSLFYAPLDFSVQALTDVRYSRTNREKVREHFQGQEFIAFVSRLLIAERRDADDQMVDLGQRLAEERIAGLVLRLRTRFLARGEVQDESFPFPLRQQHMADITGLTSVHVSRVIGHLRKSGLIEIAGGRIALHNVAELQRIGDMR